MKVLVWLVIDSSRKRKKNEEEGGGGGEDSKHTEASVSVTRMDTHTGGGLLGGMLSGGQGKSAQDTDV
jgi:hypothetical protein